MGPVHLELATRFYKVRRAEIDVFTRYFENFDFMTHSYINLTISEHVLASLKHFPENTFCI